MKFKDQLRQYLSPEEMQQVICSYDVVGDIAVILIPPSLEDREQLIGQLLLDSQPRLRVVAKRLGLYEGEFRTIGLSVIAGERRTITEVKEFGLRLRLDLGKVYFSIRSGGERKRVGNLVGPNENVLVLFSGVAPYPLVISQFGATQRIVGIEKNPDAHQFALENVRINKKQSAITLHCADAADLLPWLGEKFDRIVMPLPTMGEKFLPLALQVLNNPGRLHYYTMQNIAEKDLSVMQVMKACMKTGRVVTRTEVFRCGHCSPKAFRVCVDADIF